MQYDTYERELERYGSATMTACETIFQLDSEASTALLPRFAANGNESDRLVCAMIAIDDLLESFDLQLTAKSQWVSSWCENFFREFGGGKNLKLNLDKKFRENRRFVEHRFDEAVRHLGHNAPLGHRFDALKALNAKP